MTQSFDMSQLPGLLNFDSAHIQRSRERQCRAWRRERLDVPLLFINDALSPKQETIPTYNYKQIFTDPAKMLCCETRAACAAANGHSDSVPSIRANLGTGILLACLGLEQETFPDKMPWLQAHLSKEQVAKLTPDDIRPCGSFGRGLEMMRYFKSIMGDALPIYVMDTQGPFDLAHMLMGDAVFLELYDDPPFVHHLMNLCLELGLKTHRWMKEVIGEPLTALHHSKMLYSDSFGIRICEDTTALLGEDQIREFAIPYSKRLAQAFGGAWVHYCGYNEVLTNAILEQPEFKALNFGHIPGHQHEIDFFANMDKFNRAGKVNFNAWPPFPDETAEAYLRRLHTYAAPGVLVPQLWFASSLLKAHFKSVADILAFWQCLGSRDMKST